MAGYDQAGYGYTPNRAQSGHGYTQYAGQPDPRDAAWSGYAADPYAQTDTPDMADAPPSTAMAWVGALGSVALVVGLSVWGYSLATQDLARVPVIQALKIPAYVKPEETEDEPTRALAIDEVQGGTGTTETYDMVRLAPNPAEIAPVEVSQAKSTSAMPTEITPAAPTEDYVAMAERLSEGLAPLSGTEVPPAPVQDPVVSPTPDPMDQAALSPAPNVLPASVPGLVRAPRPKDRPSGLVDRNLQTAAVVANTGTFRDPATVPAGTVMVQFGALGSRAAAEAEWARLNRDFATYLRGKTPVIESALVGGQRYHRLRVLGFAGARDAQAFCSVFQAGGQQCYLTQSN